MKNKMVALHDQSKIVLYVLEFKSLENLTAYTSKLWYIFNRREHKTV